MHGNMHTRLMAVKTESGLCAPLYFFGGIDMDTKTVIRHVIGYCVGIAVFIVLLPGIIYLIARYTQPLGNIPLDDYVRIILALILLCIGILFMVWSNVALLVIGKGGPTDAFDIAISPRTQHLVVTGPYKYTRNPMVFGAITSYLAVAVYVNSVIAIIAIVLCIPAIIVYIKRTEEKRLERDFGEEFCEYRKKVSMVFPLPPRK